MDKKEEKKEEVLSWTVVSPDNLLVKTLKNMAGLYAHVVKKEVSVMEKDLKRARKMFHGQ